MSLGERERAIAGKHGSSAIRPAELTMQSCQLQLSWLLHVRRWKPNSRQKWRPDDLPPSRSDATQPRGEAAPSCCSEVPLGHERQL